MYIGSCKCSFSYLGIVVELFGSTHTGFALKTSDINMNLVFSDRTVSDPVSVLC